MQQNNNALELNALDWNIVLDHISQHCSSEVASSNMLRLSPWSKEDLASQHKQDIFSAKEIYENSWSLQFTSLDSYKIWHTRISKNAVLDLPELKELRLFLVDIAALLRPCSEINNSWTQKLQSEIFDPNSFLKKLDNMIHPDGRMKDSASSLLQKLSTEKRDLEQGVQNHLQRLVKDYKLEVYLQDKFVTTREGRWVLPIKNGMQGKFKGIIHDTSQTQQTVFMEPEEVVRSNNKVREIDIEIQKEIKRILTQFSSQLYDELNSLENSYQLLLEADQIFAKAKFSSQLGLKDFVYSENTIDLKSLKNPVLLLKQTKVVANDLYMQEQENRLIILSGPNAGGKTVLLKSLGIAAQMARCGLPLAVAEDSSIPFFNNIYISVGDSQNIKEGLSSFASHLQELSLAYTAKGTKDLILIDEICGSTDPEEGGAIAKAFIEHFYQQGVFALITSHLSSLKTNWLEGAKLTQASMEFDETTGNASYHLLLGVAGDSHAWKVAQRNKVPQNILDRVLEFLSPEYKIRQRQLEDVEKLKQDLLQHKIDLQNQLEIARKDKEKYQLLLKEIENKKEDLISKGIENTKKELDQIVLDARQGKLKKTTFEIKAELPRMIKKAKTPAIDQESFAKNHPPGTKVFVESLGKEAIIQSKPNEKGDVFVLSGSMRLTVKWDLLVPKQKQQSVIQATTPQNENHVSSDIDIRGLNSEEAIDKIDTYFDEALLYGLDRVKIIHGIGTGSLRKNIRKYFAISPYVKSWQSDDLNEGITWVVFRDKL